MRSWIARRSLRAFAKRYRYDVSYLEMMLNESPAAFFKFAPIMKASGHACRQLASRARRAVRDERPALAATSANHARLLQAFGEAVTRGNIAGLAELLGADAVAITDGGGRKTAARNPIFGADKVARFFIGIAAKNAGHEVRVEPAMINGAIGALLYLDGELDNTMSLATDGDRIAAIYVVRNPDKLAAFAARRDALRRQPDGTT